MNPHLTTALRVAQNHAQYYCARSKSKMENLQFEEVKSGDYKNAWNPEAGDSIEGLYLEQKTVQKYGKDNNVYTLRTRTPQGNLCDTVIFGRLDLDNKMSNIQPGQYLRITFEGYAKSKLGRQFKQFKVEIGKPQSQAPIEKQRIQ